MMLDKVKEYAKRKYKGLTYDNQDFYKRHIKHVVQTLSRFNPTEAELAAAYLHDVIEDTDATYEELVLLVGEEIADIVSRVTDKPGNNRTERHINTYYILRRSPSAIKVKLADRISNMERSIGNKYANIYVKEYTTFKFALYDGNNIDMWRELDGIYNKLKDKSE